MRLSQNDEDNSIVAILLKSAFSLRSVLILVFLSSLISLAIASDIESLALDEISNANQSVQQAYEAVLSAEEASVNTSNLLFQLDEGLSLLAKARTAFNRAEYNESIRFANQCTDIVYEVYIDAERLEMESRTKLIVGKQLSIAISSIAILTLMSISLVGYRILKKQYYKKLLKTKPRVTKV